MISDNPFDAAAYRLLEEEMRALAEREGDVFLPNVPPAGRCDYILIGMEPSLGRWASSVAHARHVVAEGFRNFISSVEDFILHFSVRTYLCGPTQAYHVTDLSKGAMLVAMAANSRFERYDRWYDLLLKEIALVAKPNARFVAIGSTVAKHLEHRGFDKPYIRVLHYSGQAAAARQAGILGREADFDAFKGSVSLDDLITTAQHVFVSVGVPASIRNATLSRLTRAQLSTSRQYLIYNYKVSFEAYRSESG